MPASEQEIIERYFRPLAGPEGFGLVDDAAVLAPEPGFDLVVTTDLVAEGVHFFADDPPGAIAAKALRVNLSDLAAKGAEPGGYTVALGLGPGTDEDWVAAFAKGLAADQERYRARLIGGDTSRSQEGTVVAITAFGRVPAGKAVRRTTARDGDLLYVSGTIGDAALGLLVRRGRDLGPGSERLLQRFLFPEPRTALAEAIRGHATAAMDISDGLAGDLTKLCLASGVGASVDLPAVPLSTAARHAADLDSSLWETALTGGDDYEILAAVPPDSSASFEAAAAASGVPVTPIGRITGGAAGPVFRDADGRNVKFAAPSFDHFARAE